MTADDVARRCRDSGLAWSRSVIAGLEAGTKTIDVGELVLLSVAMRVGTDKLLAGDELVSLSPSGSMDLDAVRRFLRGGRALESLTAGRIPGLRGTDTASDVDLVAGIEGAQKKWAGHLDITFDEATEIELSAQGEAEQKAARRLGIETLDLAIASWKRWGRSLTDERDARVAASAPVGTPARSLQALRGRVTRTLLDELAPSLKKRKGG